VIQCVRKPNRRPFTNTVRRRVFNSFCALSLAIFLLALALWARTFFLSDQITRFSNHSPLPGPSGHTAGPEQLSYIAATSRGSIEFCRLHVLWSPDPGQPVSDRSGWLREGMPPRGQYPPSRMPDVRLNLHFAGFYVFHGLEPRPPQGWYSQQCLIVPLWFFLPFAIPPLLWIRRRHAWNGRGFALESAKVAASI
jgi:hypothetical protein